MEVNPSYRRHVRERKKKTCKQTKSKIRIQGDEYYRGQGAWLGRDRVFFTSDCPHPL